MIGHPSQQKRIAGKEFFHFICILLIPELGRIIAHGNAALRQLIAAAVGPDREPVTGFVDAAFVLLDYPAWQELTRSRSSPEAARIAGDCLAGLLPRLTRPPRKGKS